MLSHQVMLSHNAMLSHKVSMVSHKVVLSHKVTLSCQALRRSAPGCEPANMRGLRPYAATLARLGSPIVILDAVSSGAEVVTFCVFIAVCSMAPIFLRDGSETISTIRIWRRGIACSCPRIQHSVPLATRFIRRLG